MLQNLTNPRQSIWLLGEYIPQSVVKLHATGCIFSIWNHLTRSHYYYCSVSPSRSLPFGRTAFKARTDWGTQLKSMHWIAYHSNLHFVIWFLVKPSSLHYYMTSNSGRFRPTWCSSHSSEQPSEHPSSSCHFRGKVANLFPASFGQKHPNYYYEWLILTVKRMRRVVWLWCTVRASFSQTTWTS